MCNLYPFSPIPLWFDASRAGAILYGTCMLMTAFKCIEKFKYWYYVDFIPLKFAFTRKKVLRESFFDVAWKLIRGKKRVLFIPCAIRRSSKDLMFPIKMEICGTRWSVLMFREHIQITAFIFWCFSVSKQTFLGCCVLF